MFDPDDLEALGKRLRGHAPPVRLTFHHALDSELSGALGRGAEALARGAAGGVRLLPDEDHPDPLPGGPAPPARPALTIAHPGAGPVHYLALPEGFEAEPFAELLERREPDEALAALLAPLGEPAELLVFVAAACPHCPNMVRAAGALALASPRVSLSVVDAQRFEELARRHRVTAAPTTIIDGGLALTGLVPPIELARRLLERGTDRHRLERFRSLVESGRFDEAADQVAEGAGAALLAALWKESTTSSRIGLMLLAEQVLERAPRGLDGVAGELGAVVDAEDAALRGDTADLLGQIGGEAARPALKRLLADPHPEVAEMAREALEELETGEG